MKATFAKRALLALTLTALLVMLCGCSNSGAHDLSGSSGSGARDPGGSSGAWLCDLCGGDGLCSKCEVKGNGVCAMCHGSGRELLTFDMGKYGETSSYHGCPLCTYDFKLNTGFHGKCPICGGTGICTKCSGSGKMK